VDSETLRSYLGLLLRSREELLLDGKYVAILHGRLGGEGGDKKKRYGDGF
jgi:hypothetical protein